MINPVILFRSDSDTKEELSVAQRYFNVHDTRDSIPSDSLIIPRYSALPYYKELEKDVIILKSQLINSYRQFQWIANFEYYELLQNYTFKTYFRPQDLPDNKQFVVKGKTNSRKHQWNTQCFAESKKKAIDIYCDLKNDSLIGTQDIIFREYVPLKTFEILLNGLPCTNEFRFFFYKDIQLCNGYYWSSAEYPEKAQLDDKAIELVEEVASIVKEFNNFFVIDIAQKEDGDWIMVELNSGEMSGLSLCNPHTLYINLKRSIASV